jgi:hypothetical protein
MARRRFLTGLVAGASNLRFAPLEPECEVVQFDQPLSASELQQAAALIGGRPEVELYVYGQASRDLDFLGYFPDLRRLNVQLYELEDISGFEQLKSNLQGLTFGSTRRTFSLRFLEGFRSLVRLFLVRHRKDLEALRKLAGLRDLGLSGITLPNLELLTPLAELCDFSLLLGATRNLSALARLPRLRRLFLMRITAMSDVSVLAELKALESLRLDWMRNVQRIPRLHELAQLENVELDTMKGLRDLSPIAAAPALRCLRVAAMPQLVAEDFRCFAGHPTLTELHAHTGRLRVNEAVKAMFPGIAR